MALDYKIGSVEGLDEPIAALYEKSDDGYVLSVAGLPESEDPIKLKETLVKVREERKQEERSKRALRDQYESQLKEMKSNLSKFDNVDPEEYETLKALKEEQILKEAEAKKDWEALQKQLQGKHQTELETQLTSFKQELETRESKLSVMQNSLHEHIAEVAIVQETALLDGNIALLKPHILPHVRVLLEEDSLTGTSKYVPRIVDSAGEIRLNAETSTPMSIKDLVSEFKTLPQFEGAFKMETLKGGSDSEGNRSTPKTKDNPWSKDFFNLTQQGQIIKKDPALAIKLKAEAGF